jgi:heme-degrading monooxygenase HmoA
MAQRTAANRKYFIFSFLCGAMPMNHELNLKPGHWAVLFISERSDDPPGYAEMDDTTMRAVSRVPGFIGWESARQSPCGVFVSYWENEAAIEAWKKDMLHARAKALGRTQWYDAYRTVICRIEHTDHFLRSRDAV